MLRAMIEGERPTRIKMGLMTFGFFVIQAALLYLLVLYNPTLIEINIIWLCRGVGNYFVVWWIGITVIAAGVVRTYAESSRFSGVEILHLRPLSPSFVFERCENCLPANMNIAIQHLTRPTGIRKWFGIGRRIHEYLRLLPSLRRRLWAAQKSHHGMVIVLRPSEVVDTDKLDTKQLLSGVCRGFFQALLLIFLTVLFGSTYRSNIMLVSIFLTCFITLMVVSRTYSIYFCAWLEAAVDAVQIEYATPAELTAIRTILSGMPCVLIHNTTRKRKYAAGHRLAPERGCSNHTGPFARPLPPGTGLTAAVLAGLAVLAGAMVFVAAMVGPGDPDDYLFRVTGTVFFWLVVGFVVGFVAEKVYDDFAFVETMEESVTAGGPGGVVSV